MIAAGAGRLAPQGPGPLAATPNCGACGEWNTPQQPFKLHGDTYYVGTRGLSALLIVSEAGHILIDGGLRESAPLIAASVRSLGFRLEDVKAIVNSHVHFDHAGGIGLLARASGARVHASSPAAEVFRTGQPGRDDPQFGVLQPIDAVSEVTVVPDSGSVRVGRLVLTMHLTGGHTPGGTSWSWRSCDSAGCVAVVYADSQTPISADGFSFRTAPRLLEAFRRGHDRLEGIDCQLLITPHPDGSRLWQRVGPGATEPLLDSVACRQYAGRARARLAARLESEPR